MTWALGVGVVSEVCLSPSWGAGSPRSGVAHPCPPSSLAKAATPARAPSERGVYFCCLSRQALHHLQSKYCPSCLKLVRCCCCCCVVDSVRTYEGRSRKCYNPQSVLYTMADESKSQRPDLTKSTTTIRSDSENYDSSHNEISPSPPSSSRSPMILYQPPYVLESCARSCNKHTATVRQWAHAGLRGITST